MKRLKLLEEQEEDKEKRKKRGIKIGRHKCPTFSIGSISKY
jgi:hypothetical protein